MQNVKTFKEKNVQNVRTFEEKMVQHVRSFEEKNGAKRKDIPRKTWCNT